MASVTKNSNEKSMADEEPEETEPDKGKKSEGARKPEPISYRTPGAAYFSIYKKGQGYWTRVGTVAGAVLIGALTAYNVDQYVPTFLPDSVSHPTGLKIAAAIAVLFALGYAYLCWTLLNKPANVDFLIATDSEMKKVNWTSRKELVGSTQIVIIFMFLIAFFLFTVDQIFGWLMYWIHVLQVSPFGNSHGG
jgi:preprotein translocase subunit SecE